MECDWFKPSKKEVIQNSIQNSIQKFKNIQFQNSQENLNWTNPTKIIVFSTLENKMGGMHSKWKKSETHTKTNWIGDLIHGLLISLIIFIIISNRDFYCYTMLHNNTCALYLIKVDNLSVNIRLQFTTIWQPNLRWLQMLQFYTCCTRCTECILLKTRKMN